MVHNTYKRVFHATGSKQLLLYCAVWLLHVGSPIALVVDVDQSELSAREPMSLQSQQLRQPINTYAQHKYGWLIELEHGYNVYFMLHTTYNRVFHIKLLRISNHCTFTTASSLSCSLAAAGRKSHSSCRPRWSVWASRQRALPLLRGRLWGGLTPDNIFVQSVNCDGNPY